jgi:hypothetical protein
MKIRRKGPEYKVRVTLKNGRQWIFMETLDVYSEKEYIVIEERAVTGSVKKHYFSKSDVDLIEKERG